MPVFRLPAPHRVRPSAVFATPRIGARPAPGRPARTAPPSLAGAMPRATDPARRAVVRWTAPPGQTRVAQAYRKILPPLASAAPARRTASSQSPRPCRCNRRNIRRDTSWRPGATAKCLPTVQAAETQWHRQSMQLARGRWHRRGRGGRLHPPRPDPSSEGQATAASCCAPAPLAGHPTEAPPGVHVSP